jgi:hypothetical protein
VGLPIWLERLLPDWAELLPAELPLDAPAPDELLPEALPLGELPMPDDDPLALDAPLTLAFCSR